MADSSSAVASSLLPLRMTSRVVRGYGRGSCDLGIPTANLDREAIQVVVGGAPTINAPQQTDEAQDSATSSASSSTLPFDQLPTGIYWGYGRVVPSASSSGEDTSIVYTAAISIGYNPTYQNGVYA
jgi:riboflavin kinase